MTLSVIYFNTDKIDQTAIGIRCCADSLISESYGNLTTNAMKILKLNLAYSPSYYSMTHYPRNITHSIGFTYAGNLNVAMITYTLLSHLCVHLNPRKGKEGTLPSIKTLTDLTARILHTYVYQFAELKEKSAFCEIILFGYCTEENNFKAFHLFPSLEPNKHIENEEIKMSEGKFFAIGTGKKLLEEQMKDGRKFHPNIVRNIIQSPDAKQFGVGGAFQRGWSNRWGMELYCDAMQYTPFGFGSPFCGFCINPYDLENHYITLPAFSDSL